MFDSKESQSAADPYNLDRFVQAQEHNYEQAFAEISSGQKRTHWMWYIFPQFDGLAFSPTSKLYALKCIAEAKAYLEHPILGPRLLECAEAALGVEGRTAREIFGSPDDMKLHQARHCSRAQSPRDSVFERLLRKYYAGERDDRTIRLLEDEPIFEQFPTWQD